MTLTCPTCRGAVPLPSDPRALSAPCPKCGTAVDLASMRTIAEPAAPAPAADQLAAGQQLGGYRIESLLGRGGMAVVYKGIQLSLNRPVAIKALPKHLAQNPAFVMRFNREAGALAALSHPNVIQIIDRGVDHDTYFFVMEFVDGSDLHGHLQKGRPAPGEAVRIVQQVCAALEYAHKRGVIHRDIKPGNIMIDAGGVVKVTDFGIAHLAGGDQTGFGLTMAGAQMGTVNYMAPEQRTDARAVDGRADIYAVGVVLYEILTGRLPLGAFEPPSRLNTAADPRLDSIVLKALKTDPKDRFQSAAEFAAALAPLSGTVAAPPQAESPPTPTNLPCPFCKAENRADARFCLQCGKTLIETCPKCRKSIRAGAKFCDTCGINVTEFVTQFKENLAGQYSEAEKLGREGRLADAITKLDTILAAEASGIDELKAKAKTKLEELRAAKEKIDASFQAGQKLYDQKEYEKAMAAWSKLPAGLAYVQESIAEARKKVDARTAALRDAEAAHKEGRWGEALAAWEKAAELSADAAPFRAKLEEARAKVALARYAAAAKRGTECEAARDWAGAAAAWAEALKHRPGDPAATGHFQQAEAQRRSAERDALVSKGDQAAAAGRPKEAIEHWEKALKVPAPENPAIKAEIEKKIASRKVDVIREDQAQRQKLILILAAGGGGLLLLVGLIVGIVVVAKGCDDSGSSSSSSTPSASTPEELFDRSKDWIWNGSFGTIWANESTRSKAAAEAQLRGVQGRVGGGYTFADLMEAQGGQAPPAAVFHKPVDELTPQEYHEITYRLGYQPHNPNGIGTREMTRGQVTIAGDRATVQCTFTMSDQFGRRVTQRDQIVFTKEGGAWRLNTFK